MKLFTVGPVESFFKNETFQEPYFRNDTFSKLMLDNEIHIKRLLYADENAKAIFFACSGSGAMEASVINIFDEKDKLLIINGGTFGQRFCDIAGYHNINYKSIKINDLESIDGSKYTGLLVNIHETSTGELYPIDRISEFCIKYNLKFVVDAISAFLVEEINFTKLKIDALIISSQKALALNCGMSCVVISDRVEKELKQTNVYYFDFKNYLLNQSRGQTPFTPTVGILYQLNKRIKELDLNDEINRVKKYATLFRNSIKCAIPNYPLSNALTPIYIKNASEVYKILKEKYGFEVTPCGGINSNSMLRIGHIGNLNEKDIIELVGHLNELL